MALSVRKENADRKQQRREPAFTFGSIDLLPYSLSQASNLKNENDSLKLSINKLEGEKTALAQKIEKNVKCARLATVLGADVLARADLGGALRF